MFLNPILYLDILSTFLMNLWIILESNKMWHHGISWWPVVSHLGKRRRSRLRRKNVVLRLVAKWAWQILPGKSGLVLDLNLIYIYTYSFFGCVFWRVDIGVCRVQMWGRSSKIACFLNVIQKASLAWPCTIACFFMATCGKLLYKTVQLPCLLLSVMMA